MAISRTTELQETIGWRIKTARVSAGLTQPELAALLFVSRAVIADWERNKYEPRLSQAGKIAIATGKPIEYLCPLPTL